MKTKIVTAFYTDIKGFPFFGHEYYAREERYLHSLRVLNNMETEIICYCNDTELEKLRKQVEVFNLTNVTLKVSNLKDFPLSERMEQIKTDTDGFKFYHEVDWNKIFLLQKEYDETYDYIYWIDVGLSHHGLFPNKYNPNSELATGMSYDFNTYSFTNLFNNKLVIGLNNFVGHKLVNLSNELKFHSTSELNRILQGGYDYRGLSVGGILGGHISKLKHFIERFFELGKKSLDQNFILNHEAIMSFMYEESKENFETFLFQTWYHADTPNLDEHTKNKMIHFSHFFDKIL
jgi:hypothetical protein